MNKPIHFLTALLALTGAITSPAETSLLQPNDRIVFVGDSITGQGAGSNGWAGLIGEALKATHPDGNFTIISLGGSGHGVGSWQNIEKKSRTESVILDVKTVDVKETLDQPVNVLVSMLGMNDVLFPRMKATDTDYDKWMADYGALIDSLKERTHPRVIALATPTMCTEDPDSPKNQAMRGLHARIAQLGKSKNYTILPTYETMLDILNEGRSFNPAFHVTADFVHPNGPGHLAVAMGMLKGLGEEKAAKYLYDKYTPNFFKKDADSLSWRVEPLPSALDSESQSYRIRYYFNSPTQQPGKVTLDVPAGWKIKSSKAEKAAGEFLVEGTPDHLANSLVLKAGAQQAEIPIPAPWLIGTGNVGGEGWFQGQTFDPEKKPRAIDGTLSKGIGFGTLAELEPGKPVTWKRHSAGVDFGGGNSPGAIDMAGVTFYQNFDVGYGARWIYSETERPLTIQVLPSGFAAGSYLTLWLNGEKFFGDHIKKAKEKDPATVTLKKGWNALVFKSNHVQTQWQFAINILGDNLETLKFSAVPKNP